MNETVVSRKRHGLPQSFISNFTQDKDGFIWISTLDGLSRFDGREFKNLQSDIRDSTTIAGNVIYKMLIQADSSKLTLVYEGLQYDCFDTRTFVAKRISNLPALHRISKSKARFLNRGKCIQRHRLDFRRIRCSGNRVVKYRYGQDLLREYCQRSNGEQLPGVLLRRGSMAVPICRSALPMYPI